MLKPLMIAAIFTPATLVAQSIDEEALMRATFADLNPPTSAVNCPVGQTWKAMKPKVLMVGWLRQVDAFGTSTPRI